MIHNINKFRTKLKQWINYLTNVLVTYCFAILADTHCFNWKKILKSNFRLLQKPVKSELEGGKGNANVKNSSVTKRQRFLLWINASKSKMSIVAKIRIFASKCCALLRTQFKIFSVFALKMIQDVSKLHNSSKSVYIQTT